MKLTKDGKQPVLHVPVGPSGSGKSTLFNKLKQETPDLVSFSWDTLRLEWYDPNDYTKAWQKASKDKGFYARALKRFLEMASHAKNIYVDNVNLTTRSRQQFLNEAKKLGYKTVAHVFDVTKETLLERQKSRSDKVVPVAAVLSQLKDLRAPVQGDGEFDQVLKVL